MNLPLRTAARVVAATAAGAVGSAALRAGYDASASWALLGGALVGALSALERITTGDSGRSLRAFIGGALVGAPAGALAWYIGTSVGPAVASLGSGLVPVVTDVVAFGILGVVSGATPGFFSFSAALSRGGAVGGGLGAMAGGALASLVGPWMGPIVGATAIGAGYVAWRRTHAAARLAPLAADDGKQQMDITLRGHWVAVGTGPECDLRLDDSGIERLRPLVIVLRDGSYWVEDPLGRRGLLKVNGAQTIVHRLKHGDVIEMGRVRYRFEELRVVEPRALAAKK
jgi:hypothetical protein